ncbi:tripartite tricarboxylate transporter permease [Shinella sedimenti]|uniref:Tripartite tricarboxylate transporter permease n=1 Tax=Shinella sedimenti TaxID=2919913 RepID=A0ABT0CNR2_9HYPH|nr:tripartite tricarboxylate transporter permease [Shinella sedimenti]MCJ8150247.1 tripartite tricarboxylate transporter permease [Shinella sedimenti]
MNDILSNVVLGLSVALSWQGLLYCAFGVVMGMIVGVLPGLGALAAISILFPVTYHIEPGFALIMIAGIYYGTSYGGKITAILMNVPGETDAAVICLDGYPMARQGRAGVALLLTTLAAFGGAAIGIVITIIFSPAISKVALAFGSPEYFALMTLGLFATTAMSDSAASKSLGMAAFGIVLGLVGVDVDSGADRFTFGLLTLKDGISLVVVAMGVFGVAELIMSYNSKMLPVNSVTMRSMLPTRDDLRRIVSPILRGTGVGAFFGALPGTGATVSTFIAYGLERGVAKDKSRFGKGAVEGLTAPEAAANSASITSFIPTLMLGVPGSASMALILSLLIVHGIAPGPRLILDHPQVVWGLIMSFWVGNLILVILNIPLIGVWVRLLRIPTSYMYPMIMMFISIGTYSIRLNVVDVGLVVLSGLFGIWARRAGFPLGPLLLGYVLGPLLEEHFRRTLVLSGGDPAAFISSKLAMVVYAIILFLSVWKIRARMRNRKLVALS